VRTLCGGQGGRAGPISPRRPFASSAVQASIGRLDRAAGSVYNRVIVTSPRQFDRSIPSPASLAAGGKGKAMGDCQVEIEILRGKAATYKDGDTILMPDVGSRMMRIDS